MRTSGTRSWHALLAIVTVGSLLSTWRLVAASVMRSQPQPGGLRLGPAPRGFGGRGRERSRPLLVSDKKMHIH